MKDREYNAEDCYIRDKELSENEICVATRDGLPSSTQYELDNKDKYYHSVTHKKWCDLLSIMDEKDNRKRAGDKIKILVAYKAAQSILIAIHPQGCHIRIR